MKFTVEQQKQTQSLGNLTPGDIFSYEGYVYIRGWMLKERAQAGATGLSDGNYCVLSVTTQVVLLEPVQPIVFRPTTP